MSHILLAGVQSADLPILQIHQEGGAAVQVDDSMDDPTEGSNGDGEHSLAVELSACNRIQGAPWGAG